MRKALTIFLQCVCLSVLAQEVEFLPLGLEEGLAQSQVNQVHQDQHGFLWAATVGGLSRFDGSHMTNFFESDGLLDNDISCITEHPEGLLFGGLGGFSFYDGTRFEAFPFPDSLTSSRVTIIGLTDENNLWLGTTSLGLLVFDWSEKTYSQSIPTSDERIRWLDGIRGMWSSNRGIYENRVLVDTIFKDVRVTDFVEDESESWISSLRDGLFHYSAEKGWTSYPLPIQNAPRSIRDLMLDRRGRLWAATRDGLLRYESGIWTHFKESNGLDYANVRSVHEDLEGNIWVSTNGKGLYRFSGDVFTAYKEGNPLTSAPMLSAIRDDKGNLLLGMFDAGLQCLEKDDRVSSIHGLPDTDIWSMVEHPSAGIILGTSIGLYTYEDGTVQPFLTARLTNDRVTCLMVDEMNRLWIGHREGVDIWDAKEDTLTPLTYPEGTMSRVRALRGNMEAGYFIGAENGLFHFRSGDWKRWDEAVGLADNTIYSLSLDDHGLWIGSKTGLQRLENDHLNLISLSASHSSSPVNSLYALDERTLLIGTNQGLYRLDHEEGNAERSYHFGRAEGLPGLECNLNAIWADSSGTVWLGLSDAVVRFERSDILHYSETPEPRLQLREVRLFAEPFPWRERVEDGILNLQTEEDHLTFDFHGIWLSKPSSVLYSYRMVGVDEDWSVPSDIHSVTYSGLGFGEYRFEARVTDTMGIPLAEEVSQEIVIATPFFLRWWALLIQITIGVLVIWLFLRWRTRVAKEKQTTLELGYKNRMYALEQQSLNSSMNRHFIFNALNAIQFYINREDKRSANRYLSRFAKLIRKNLDSTLQTWVSLKDEIERLELYLDMEQMRFTDRFDYEITIGEDVVIDEVKVPAMMLQPFFENSIWHGILPKEDKGTVWMEVDKQGSDLHITIQDDGIGIERSRSSKGSELLGHESKGMDITSHRVELFAKMTGGRFELKGPEQVEEGGIVLGTKTELIIPC